MKILYHHPNPDAINAHRTIFNGFQNAFLDLGHKFEAFTSDDHLESKLDQFAPDVFITSSHFYYQKFLDFKLLRRYRDKGMFLLTKIDFWNSPINKNRINEAKSLKDDKKTTHLISDGLLGDAFFHVVEQGDERMDGFSKTTGYPFHTIPLAADKIVLANHPFEKRFQADISFIGTYLPQKKIFFDERVFPLQKMYDTKIYGQDWTAWDRNLGYLQKVAQFFNVPVIKSIRKPKLKLEDEGSIYNSSLISINVHEDYQRQFGGDCNERTFKIPLCDGFEISDDVACIRKYFKEDEIVVSKDKDDWYEKIDFYIKNPDKRLAIIEKGKLRVLADHTYHCRANQILEICLKK